MVLEGTLGPGVSTGSPGESSAGSLDSQASVGSSDSHAAVGSSDSPASAGSLGSYISPGSHASAGSSGFRASAETTGPLLIPGIVLLVGVLRLEPHAREGYCHACSLSGALGRQAPAPQPVRQPQQK